MSLNSIAPVLIFTYNRLNTLESLIHSLKENFLSKNTDIIVFSDYPKTDNAIKSVLAVRNFLKTITGFNSIKIVERTENYGLAKNIIKGVTEVINEYGSVIVLEDDLITSPNFLNYMNQALNFYKDNEKIFAISGYTANLESLATLEEDIYLSYRPSSWGWATWKEEWNGIDWNVKDFATFYKNKNERKKFNKGGVDMTRMLKHCMEGKNHSWAIRWSYAMYKQNKFCVYPKVSKIQNIGFGKDATNCTGIDIYQTNLDNSLKVEFYFPQNPTLSMQLIKEFRYTFSYTNKIFKRIQNYLFGIKN
jgi:hypothetical protein